MQAEALNVIALVAGIVASLISGWVMCQYTRRQAIQDALQERVRLMELKQAEQMGEEKLRQVISDELAKWELCLMKEGRLSRRGGGS